MTEKLGSLVVNVEGDMGKFVADVDGAVAALNKVGKAADSNSDTFDRSTRRMVANIERQIRATTDQIAAVTAGGRSNAEYFASIANQRGVSSQAIEPYLNQLREVQKQADLAASAQKKLAESTQFIERLKQQTSAIGKSAADLAELKAQALGVTAAAAPMIAKLREQEAATTRMGAASANTAQQMRQVAPQITDIVTQIAGGQSPVQIFIQQGGQLKDVFGGVGPAFKAVGGYLAGMITPMSVGVGVIGALALAAYKGASQVADFTNQVILSGNATGKTVGDLRALSVELANTNKVTQGTALESLTAMANQGRVAGDNLQRYTTIAQQLDKLVGKPVADTAKEFADLATAPVEASLRLTEKYNYLTSAVYAQIRALKDQGRETEAVALAQGAYAGAMETRIPQMVANVGYLEAAWSGVAGAIKKVYDAALELGKPQTLQQQIEAMQTLIAKHQERNKDLGIKDGAVTDEMKQQLSYLNEVLRLQRRSTSAQEQETDRLKARATFNKLVEDSLSKQEKLAREIAQAESLAQAAGASRAETEKVIANIRKKYFEADSSNAQIEALKQSLALREQLTRDALDRVASQYRLGALNQVQSIEMVGQAEVGQLEASRNTLTAELAIAKTKVNSLKEQAELRGRIEQLEQAIGLRRIKMERDIAEAIDLTKVREYLSLLEQQRQEQAEISSAEVAATARWNAAWTAVQDYARSIEDANEQLGYEYSLLGKTTQQIALENEQRRISLELRRQLRAIDLADITGEEKSRLIAQAEAAAAMARASVSSRVYLEEFNRVTPIIGQHLYDALTGKAGSAAQAIKAMFSQLVLQPTFMAAINPVASAVSTTLGVAGPGASMLGSLGSFGMMGSNFGAGLSTGFSTMLNSGLGAGLELGGGLMGAGSTMGGLGTMAGAAGPYVLAAIAAYKLLSGGETRLGGQYRDSTLLAAPSGGQIDAGNITSAITATTASINGFFSKLGSSTRLGEFFSGLESSGSGKGFAYAGGTLSTGAVFGQGYDGMGYMNRRGNFDPAAAASAFGEELSQSILQALQADLDHLPEYVKKYLAGVDIDALGKDAADKLLATINNIATQKATLDKQIYELTTSDAQKLADARSDERKAMDESLWPLLDRRIALEDERAATEKATAAAQEKARVDEQIANERQSIWRQIWQMEGNTAALREDQLKGMNEANQALQKYYWSLSDQAAAAEKARAAHERYQQSMNEAQTFLSGVWTNIGQYLDRMNASSAGMLSPKDQLTNAEAQFRRQAALAAGGDRTALSGITQYADQLAAATKAVSGSGGRTGEIYQLIQSTLSVLPSLVRPEQLIVDAITSLQSHTVSALAANTAATASTLGRAFDQISSGFTKLDVNFDGLLSRTEMEAALVKTGLATSADITALMAAYDTNGDGMISYLEKIEGNTRDFAVKVTQNFLGAATVSTGGQAGTRLYEYTAYANGQTYRTTADHAWTANGYAASNPEVVSYFNQNYGLIAAMGQPSNIADYLEWHFRTYGIAEGRKFALGSAFDGGGVVNTPTWFNADQMAEAGPEAIMPLARAANGKLGVQAVGTGRQGSSDPAVAAALRAVASSLSQGQQGTLAIKVVTTDGRELANQVIELARERSRRGELVIYSSGVKKV